ncbi:6-bladed beta-propeller [Membranicola marinus]|uniref:6-bladed beta-propeller n=1 Tax=Membranihabitans marinus TaxID=1227546 RepID=A0A953LBX8_9BACT|nr:6-bladed beta-propeller [Membranihabitans marinus]MBY5960238.1 6-bladed beta-propeller [Membranihabitans marinus]
MKIDYYIFLWIFLISYSCHSASDKVVYSGKTNLLKLKTSNTHHVSRDSLLKITGLHQIGNVYNYPIGRIQKIKHTTELFVFEDHNRLIIIDKEGNILDDSLEHFGKQAGGYQSIQEFDIEGDSLIYIFDPRAHKILQYDYNFQFIREMILPNVVHIPINDLIINEGKIIVFEKGKREEGSRYTFTKIDLLKNLVESHQTTIMPPGILPGFHSDPVVAVDSGLLFKTTFCSDTIYSLSEEDMTIEPSRVILFDNQPSFSQIFQENEDPQYHMDNFELVSNYNENKDYIIFTSVKKVSETEYQYPLWIWDKNLKELYSSHLEKYFVNFQCFGITDDNVIFTIVTPESLIMFKEEFPEKARKLIGLEQVDLNHNPYLLKFTINSK